MGNRKSTPPLIKPNTTKGIKNKITRLRENEDLINKGQEGGINYDSENNLIQL